MKFVVLNPKVGTRRSIDVPRGETFTILNEEVAVPGEVVYSLEELQKLFDEWHLPLCHIDHDCHAMSAWKFLVYLQEQAE